MAPRDLIRRLAALTAFPLLPLLYLQGRGVRRRATRLPEAGGPLFGSVPGGEPELRVLVFGESTAAGVGAPTHAQALAGSVAAALARATGRRVGWEAVGRSGVSASEARRDLVPRVPGRPVEVIVIALGVNDVLRLRGARAWQRDLQRLIVALRERVGPARVILAPVPPMHRFPALPQPLRAILGARAWLLDRAAHALAPTLEGVRHAELAAPTDADGFFCEDGFHPSMHGYLVWAEQLVQATLQDR